MDEKIMREIQMRITDTNIKHYKYVTNEMRERD